MTPAEQSGRARRPLPQLTFSGRLPVTWSEPKVFRLVNRSRVPLSIKSARIIGPHKGDFAICAEDFSGVQLYPGTWCRIGVRFRPSGNGWRTAELLVSRGRKKKGWRIALAGYGASLELISDCPDPVARLHDLVTVKVEALGRCGNPALVWGKAEMVPLSDCRREFRQSLLVAVPISVLVQARCEKSSDPVRAVFHTAAVQPMEVSVPLHFDARPQSSRAHSPRQPVVQTCERKIVQRLKVELPVTFDARVICRQAESDQADAESG